MLFNIITDNFFCCGGGPSYNFDLEVGWDIYCDGDGVFFNGFHFSV